MNPFFRSSRSSRSSHLLLLCFFCLPGIVLAERADRDHPVNLEAERVSVDDIKRVHIFEGNVVLSQGTLVIRSEKLVVTQDAQGFQKGVATGGTDGLARFRQKREGKDEFVEGEAERIEYDSRSEKAEFFKRAYVKSGGDEVRGDYISFDALTEQYLVTAAPGSKPGSAPGRVRATIQPKK
jgi:lipopolysaccharide export system protein LptA